MKCDKLIFTEKIIRSKRSGPNDDDKTTAFCRKGYFMARCECEPEGSCDGSWILSDKHGEWCVAHNSNEGKGVVVSEGVTEINKNQI